MKGRKTQQPVEHIREEPRGKKKKKTRNKKERRTWIGRPRWRTALAAWPGSRIARTARPRLRAAWPGLAWPGFFSLCFYIFFFSLGSSGFGFFFGLYKLYKSSLKDSIFICSRGKICHVRNY